MTQEDKELLLKDICARLPYGVIIHHKDFFDPKYPRPNETLTIGNLAQYTKDIERWGVKPYLRSMSSMTEEERTEYLNACGNEMDNAFSSPRYCGIDYLNAHHFDYRGLIPKDLAIEVTEENNPYKK